MGEMNMGGCFVDLRSNVCRPGASREREPRLLVGCREQRHGARLVVQRESRRAASIPRHFGENRSSAERQPVAGNFHARTEDARPRLPFFQKLLPLLYQTLFRFESGRICTTIRQNYLVQPVAKIT